MFFAAPFGKSFLQPRTQQQSHWQPLVYSKCDLIILYHNQQQFKNDFCTDPFKFRHLLFIVFVCNSGIRCSLCFPLKFIWTKNISLSFISLPNTNCVILFHLFTHKTANHQCSRPIIIMKQPANNIPCYYIAKIIQNNINS